MKVRFKSAFNIFTLVALLAMLFGLTPTLPVYAESLSNPPQTSGDLLWAKSMGGMSDDYGTGIAVDSSGNVYTTGTFQGLVDLDPGPGTYYLTGAGSDDIYVSKQDRNGNLIWAESIGSTSTEQSMNIAVDSNDNVYITGTFANTVDFDPDEGIYNLTGAGGYDIFVSKLDGDGNFVWARSMGGSNNDFSFGISVDSNFNVYTTGSFYGTADFDPGTGTFNLVPNGGSDIFVSKLDGNGNFVWARSVGGPGFDAGNDIVVDSSGNSLITGSFQVGFQGGVDFDPGAGIFSLTDGGGFVSKLDDNGNFLWARKMGSLGNGVALDPGGNVYTTGIFEGPLDFDPGPGTFNLIGAGWWDTFVSKLDRNGNFLWAKELGGISMDYSKDIAVDTSGNVYTTGEFSGTSDFDPGPGTANLICAGSTDIFVSKLDGSGNFVWARNFGGAYDYRDSPSDSGSAIALDSGGNIYTTGTFAGIADFDPGAGVINLTSIAGTTDVFVAKFEKDSAPTTSFIVDASSSSRNIPITTFTALNAVGYMITTSATPPAVDNPGWSATAPTTYTVSTDGSYTLYSWIKDTAGNVSLVSGAPVHVSVDTTAPTVVSSLRTNTTPNSGNIVDFTVTFSEPITGVSADDFSLTTHGITGAMINGVSGSGTTYTVSVNTGNGNGTIRLDISSSVTIADLIGNPLMAGIASDEIYTVIKTPTFADVPFSYWAWGYIERLYSAGITGGCSVNPLNYCPDSPVTRAQMAVFLLKGIHGSSYTPPAVEANTSFTDVAIDYWAAAWIKQLAVEGITGGCGTGIYCPDAAVTRAQMAVFLLRTKHSSDYVPLTATGVFSDVPVGYWADKWIEQLAIEGVTTGCGAGIYCPDDSVTRAQMAVFLVKVFNLP